MKASGSKALVPFLCPFCEHVAPCARRAVLVGGGVGFIVDCQLGFPMCDCRSYLAERDIIQGAVAQMVERSLSMREVAGSIPASSIFQSFGAPSHGLSS